MSPTKWIESVNAIGIVTKAGRLILFRKFAVKQMKTLAMVSLEGLKQLPGGDAK